MHRLRLLKCDVHGITRELAEALEVLREADARDHMLHPWRQDWEFFGLYPQAQRYIRRRHVHDFETWYPGDYTLVLRLGSDQLYRVPKDWRSLGRERKEEAA